MSANYSKEQMRDPDDVFKFLDAVSEPGWLLLLFDRSALLL